MKLVHALITFSLVVAGLLGAASSASAGEAAHVRKYIESAAASQGISMGPYDDFPSIQTTYIWSGAAWDEVGRGTATRDGQDRIEQILFESKNFLNQTWSPSLLIEFVNTGNFGPSVITTSIWSASGLATSGVWIPTYRSTFTYNGSGYLTEEIGEIYSGVWENSDRSIYTNNVAGYPTQIVDQVWDIINEEWANDSRSVIVLSGSRPTSITYESWAVSQWVPTDRSLYTYSGSLETEQLDQIWSGSSWSDDSRTQTVYNGSLATSSTTQNFVASTWENDTRELFDSYDGQGRILDWISQSWRGTWQNESRLVFEYDSQTSVDDDGVSILPNSIALMQNYPNPFNPNTTIAFSLEKKSVVSVAVFDLLGRQVTTLHSGLMAAGDHAVEWNGTDAAGSPVATGIYFYRVTTESGSLTRKMALIK